MTLCAELFGQRNVGTIYGFVFGAHQFGAALLAFLAGFAYDRAGDYTIAFVGAGVLGLVGGLMAMRIERPAPAAPLPAASPAD
jgi:sugar phosphate permease